MGLPLARMAGYPALSSGKASRGEGSEEPPLFMLRFVVALQAEARPLVERFGMVAVSESPFPVYRGEEGWLIVSGHGKAASAAATAYLHLAAGGALGRAWLNVGLGGHGRRTLGDGVLAHKITDAASGASWYPELVDDVPCPT